MATETLLDITIQADDTILAGELGLPSMEPKGLVLFAHGSGSSRLSTRNQYVAAVLRDAGFSTLLFDLLTQDEEQTDMRTAEFRFNIPFLARRLLATAEWAEPQDWSEGMRIGYFGASTGAAAAIIAAAERPERVGAVVSRGGRPDLAGNSLLRVKAPTMLIVGGDDEPVIGLNRQAYDELPAPKEMVIVPGATHLFEEPGTLERVGEHATDWFKKYLPGQG